MALPARRRCPAQGAGAARGLPAADGKALGLRRGGGDGLGTRRAARAGVSAAGGLVRGPPAQRVCSGRSRDPRAPAAGSMCSK